jgi:signal transduction histidine kinase
MLLDAEQRTLRIAASRGLAHPEGTELAVGDGIAGKVAQLGEAVVVEDIETDPRFARASDPKYGGGSFICLPIRARDQVIGVINLARKQPGADAGTVPFSATDLYFLNALMTNVAYAVDNARMLEDSRESARRLQAALDDVKAAQTRLVQGETLRALGELASGMAHHLNNLLSVVIGRIDLLLGLVDVPDHRRRLEAVRAAAHDAADVVRRMLRFTERQRSANMGAVDLNAVAREAVDRLRPRWSDPRRAIHLALELGDIPPVWGDEAALCEALHHVLVNAVEALPNGGAVVVRTWASDDAVVCAVEDTGAGMSEEERAHATEPFFTTKGPKGTGLGLSATYGIIEQHGGELSIASAAGRGTTVTMRLPLAPAAARRPGLPSPGLRILLVDDDHALRHVLADILGEEGHAVVEATRGADALMHLERGEPFDLVLTDLHMPDVTGWDVARAVKARWPKIAVVLITGSGPDAEGTDAEREVVDMTLAKPVTIEALRAMAETIGAR